MIWTKTVTFLKSLVTKWFRRRQKKFLAELIASTEEAWRIKRGEQAASRTFVYGHDLPVYMRAGAPVEIELDDIFPTEPPQPKPNTMESKHG